MAALMDWTAPQNWLLGLGMIIGAGLVVFSTAILIVLLRSRPLPPNDDPAILPLRDRRREQDR